MAAPLRLAELPWTEVDALDRDRTVCILPLGAVEAHGPHLPLSTDSVIAEAMAEEGGRLLAGHDRIPLLLPTLPYVAAPFAAGFAGTVSVRPETVGSLVEEIAAALAEHGFAILALANAHLDPVHLAALHRASHRITEGGRVLVAFPDLTRKPWAGRLGEEFASGACHAGRFEGSVVLARRPEWVREEARRELPLNPRSLSQAIRQGVTTFEQAGGPQAYFGDPAAASAEEGRQTVAALAAILAEAVLALPPIR
ncbi:MAG TPA: creatininase family protein [Thermoanaerobaculia bacterium]|nr:creatininase family protein [Thermoanaerobaculia bacterium]